MIAGALVLLTIAACVGTWVRVGMKWHEGGTVLPYQPRRPVLWGGVDVIVALVVCYALEVVAATVVRAALGAEAVRPPAIYDPEKTDVSHYVARLMESAGPRTLLLCLISVVVIAPIVEEFFFRVLLLGWLDKLERRSRKRLPTLRRFAPYGLWPILLSSFLFAMMHFRAGPTEINKKAFAWFLAGDGVAKLLTAGFMAGWLRWRVGATATDFGLLPKNLLGNVRLGLIAFLMMTVPVYGLQFVASQLLPKYVAPDPIPLFLLAIMLGLLYYRTRRIVPPVTLHAALNATSFAVMWLHG